MRTRLDPSQFDVIALDEMHLQCIVGIHPHERIKRQPLEVSVRLFLDRKPGTLGTNLADSVDYGFIAGDVSFLLENGRFQLLETAAEAICAMVLGPAAPDRPTAPPVALEVSLRKPLALGGQAIPSVCISRWASELSFGEEINGFGRVDILHENADCGVYQLRIEPQGCIPRHHHQVMGEAELILSDGLLLQGEPVGAGLGHVWPNGFVHMYENPTDVERSILCINRPAFIPEDEILAPNDAPLLPVHAYRKRYFGLPQPHDLKPSTT